MNDALHEWAEAHARSVSRGGSTAIPATVAPGTRTAVGSGSLGGVIDRTPDELRPYARLCLTVLPDGQPLGVASAMTPPLNRGGLLPLVFTLLPRGSTGLRTELLPRFPFFLEPMEWPIGWARTAEGDALLATGGGDQLHVRGIGDGHQKRSFDLGEPVESAKLLPKRRDGGVLLAARGSDNIVIWDLADGKAANAGVSALDVTSMDLREVALPDGGRLLATGHRDGRVDVRYLNDAGPGPRLWKRHDVPHAVWAVAWGSAQPDGSALLASGHDNGSVCVYGATGIPQGTLSPPCTGRVDSVAWAVAPNGLSALASGHSDGTVRIWDWQTGSVLHEFDDLTARGVTHSDVSCTVDWLLLPGGTVWLYAAAETGTRIWEIELDGLSDAFGLPQQRTAATGQAAAVQFRHFPVPLRHSLVRLATSGVCPSLGLLHDLVTLTGPATEPLLDERLRSLADHPGLRLLRDLRWPVAARAGLAGLLAAGLSEPNTIPPPDHGPRELSEALRRALIGGLSRMPEREPPLAELTAAADAVTGRTAALLAVIGPQAVADDPVLPLRLAQQAPAMPSVDLRRLRILTGAASTTGRHAGTVVHAPGSGGVSRKGRITQLIPSQLALPAHLLTLRHARHELLYRLHSSAAQWVPEPVTLVLDTSPPTFGPPEVVLRSLAHLLATTLWRHDRHAAFVGLDRPELLRPVSRPADLAMLWTSRTLEPPDLQAALKTAASAGMPTVLLALHHLVRDHTLVAGPRLRLATTHMYDDPPRGRPAEGHHVHLPPDAGGRRFEDAIRLLLTGEAPS
ncbi:hypothetical protein [Streptomyces sp. 2A115]|uniref:hypothetical protein n=1 Tax=Streptomyces sp. 2A115 TaxID=3457439 RepID=UPI003FD34B2A